MEIYGSEETGMIDRSNWSHITYVTLLCANTVAGNIGNICVIGAILSDKRLRKICNMFIMNLAIADLCVTGFVDPFSIAGSLNGPDFFVSQPKLCHFIGSICLISCVCSLYSIAAISINRYILLCRRRLYFKLYTKIRTLIMILGLWLFALLLDLPNYVNWGDHTFDMKTLSCSYDRTESYSYTVFFISFFVIIPLFTVIFCNINIYIVVVRSGMKVSAHSGIKSENRSVTVTWATTGKVEHHSAVLSDGTSNPSGNHLATISNEKTANKTSTTLQPPIANVNISTKARANNCTKNKKIRMNMSSELKLAKTLFIVFMLFCVSWTPYASICLIDRFDRAPKEAYLYCILLAHGSSSLNSIIYAVTNQSFREGYKMFFRKFKCWK